MHKKKVNEAMPEINAKIENVMGEINNQFTIIGRRKPDMKEETALFRQKFNELVHDLFNKTL